MSVLGDLQRLSAAEEFFAYLGVEYDMHVVNVARLHILRRMGQYLKTESSADWSDDEARAHCKAHLQAAYDDFVARTPIEERVFKVHQDAIKPAEPALPKQIFVPLSSLK